MTRAGRVLAFVVLSMSLAATPGLAADQTIVGAGNAEADALATRSPLVQSALNRLRLLLRFVEDRSLRDATVDALFNPATCIAHRAGLTASGRQSIVAALHAQGLYSDADASAFPGGAGVGIFPPVAGEGSACPHLPQGFGTAPGSGANSHHAYPGGLANHEAFNTAIALGFSNNYKLAYGMPGFDGLPRMAPIPGSSDAGSDFHIVTDEIIAAPMWHDWAKSIVFQWNADGTEFSEFSFGGNGSTDNNGQPGDSRTGGHHILSLAEAMARKLPARFIVAQASAHSAPTLGNEYKVVNWIRTAALIAKVDPIASGYLTTDASGNPRLPPRGKSGEINLNAAGQTNVFVEDTIHNLSDADFVLSIPAVTESQVILQNLAPRYGYSAQDITRYTRRFRNPALSYLSAERILILYTQDGVAGVQRELDILRAKGVI